MKITIIQHKVLPTKGENIVAMEDAFSSLEPTDMVILPEMWLSPYQNEVFRQNAIRREDAIYKRLQTLAKTHNVYLVAGSVPELDGDALYNTCFVFDPKGQEIARYRKIHLFAITYPDGSRYDEGETITKGTEIVTFDTTFGRFGVMICFDIRFPLLAKQLQERDVKAIIVPAAFNSYTGPAHWTLAFRSRAVDNQLFMIGVSPSEDSSGSYNYYGHSIVVDPFGTVLFEADGMAQIQTIVIDLNDVNKIRKAFPIVI